MKVRLLPPASPDWSDALLRMDHDFFHTSGYTALQADWSGGKPCALHVQDGPDELLLPLIIRPTAGEGLDATTPYGYSGPVATDRSNRRFIHEALRAGVRFLADEGLVSLFVRLHPLLDIDIPDGLGATVVQGDTVVVDLSLDEAELWRQTRRDHRNQINRARRTGQRVILDTNRGHELEFERLYLETMARLGASPEYRYDSRYFDGLRAVLGDRLRLIVVEIDGATAAAALFVQSCGIVQYFLSGSDDRFRRALPTKLLIHAARSWAKAEGHRWLHLGGGVGAADDALFHFKAGFSELRRPFRTLRVVLRPDTYRMMVDRTDVHGNDDPAGFFPAYRHSLPDSGRAPGSG